MDQNTKDIDKMGVNAWNVISAAVTFIGPGIIVASSLASMAFTSSKSSQKAPVRQMQENKIDALSNDNAAPKQDSATYVVPAYKIK